MKEKWRERVREKEGGRLSLFLSHPSPSYLLSSCLPLTSPLFPLLQLLLKQSTNIHSGSAQPAQRLCTASPAAVHSQWLCTVAVHSQPNGCARWLCTASPVAVYIAKIFLLCLAKGNYYCESHNNNHVRVQSATSTD